MVNEEYGHELNDLLSFREEGFFIGPDVEEFSELSKNYKLFHIEIFTALAGKQKELIKEREMENAYLENIDRRPNLIFKRVFGPSWDSFTLGGYDDMHDFAGPELSFEEEDKAAKDAGFEGVNYISSYLRSLISRHNDTLAKKVDY